MRPGLFGRMRFGATSAPPAEGPAANPYGGKNLFVSTAGSDVYVRAENSESTPFASVAYGISEMQAGDILYLRGGTYTETGINIATKSDGTAAAPYIIQSYPGEWAILDGNRAGSGNYQPVIASGLGSNISAVSYWSFRRMEITGGGNLTTLPYIGAGLQILAVHCTFQYLYLHDNYAQQTQEGACGGLILANVASSGDGTGRGSHDNLIEHCWFQCNGNPTGTEVNTANANLVVYADYSYANATTLGNATGKNIIRYNRFDAVGDGGTTPAAVAYKGFQRLTGYTHGEGESVADNDPHDASGRAYGDDIHHNVSVGHSCGIRVDQDYVQVHHNILDMDDALGYGGAAVTTSDPSGTDRRGSFWACVYNNTVLAKGAVGLKYVITKNGWDGITDGTDCDYSHAFSPNNLIDGALSDAGNEIKAWTCNNGAMTNCAGIQPHDWADFVLSRNFFFGCQDQSDVFYVERGGATIAAAVAGGAADVCWAKTTPSPYVGASGADQYKATGSYALDGTYTIANGGLGGDHPYLAGVTIPGYVGAVDPADSGWVDTVLGLSSVATLQEAA